MDHRSATPPDLTVLARACERGDWRTVMSRLTRDEPLGGDRNAVELASGLRVLADSMRLQTIGDALGAAERVQVARLILTRVTGAPEPGPEPRPERATAHAAWRVLRVVRREEDELAALRRIFRDAPRGRREVLYAFIEHFCLIEFDPWTIMFPPRDRQLLGLDGTAFDRFGSANRRDICDRATNLRQLGEARSGSVSEKIWQRSDGCRQLRAEALAVLAEEPLTRWERPGVPVRLGRQRAWQFARQLRADTR